MAASFRAELEKMGAALRALPATVADKPWREGGWTGRQILGHLLDSSANNRQRFVRAALDGHYEGPGYEQEGWVAMHGYAEQSWETLLGWWRAEHEILAAVVDHIPAERLGSPCIIASGQPVTLEYVVTDYLRHQRHHLAQLREE